MCLLKFQLWLVRNNFPERIYKPMTMDNKIVQWRVKWNKIDCINNCYTFKHILLKASAYLLLPVGKTGKSVIVWIPLLQVHENIILNNQYDVNQQRGERFFKLKFLKRHCIAHMLHWFLYNPNYLASMCHFISSSVTSYRRMKSGHQTEVISDNKSSEPKSQRGRHLGQ